ncbi:MAG: hypothetical protein WBV39_11225, partial [Rudaea sp.]
MSPSIDRSARTACGSGSRTILRAIVASALLLGSAGICASTFTVNDPIDAVDTSPGDGVCASAAGTCTLRAAIQEANALAGPDTVVLQSNVTYMLTRLGVEDEAASGDLDILESVDISVANNGTATIDGNRPGVGERVFQIFACTANAFPCDLTHLPIVVNMFGLTIQNGTASDIGGGILNSGSLRLTRCIITGNVGSGIFSNGDLILHDSTISANLTVAGIAYGAGILNMGSMSILNSTINDNKTTDASS